MKGGTKLQQISPLYKQGEATEAWGTVHDKFPDVFNIFNFWFLICPISLPPKLKP